MSQLISTVDAANLMGLKPSACRGRLRRQKIKPVKKLMLKTTVLNYLGKPHIMRVENNFYRLEDIENLVKKYEA